MDVEKLKKGEGGISFSSSLFFLDTTQTRTGIYDDDQFTQREAEFCLLFLFLLLFPSLVLCHSEDQKPKKAFPMALKEGWIPRAA